jgi:hypothetical protein
VIGIVRRRGSPERSGCLAQIEEEVALEEDARRDLDLSVLVHGRPESSTVKVTSDKSPTLLVLTTSPTLTPAIRTGEALRTFAEFEKTA